MMVWVQALNNKTTPVIPPIIDLQGANIVVDGNSLSTSQGGGAPYSDTLRDLLNADGFNVTMANFAVGGQTTLNMISDYASQIAPAYQAGKENILIAWEIRNHLVVNSPTIQQAYDDFETYCNLAKSTGYKVIVLTIMPSWTATYKGDSTITGYELLDSDRLACNILLRSGFTDYAVGLVDIGATAGLANLGDNEQAGYVFSATRPTTSSNGYFDDGTHNTSAGKDVIAQQVYNKLIELNS